MVSVNEQIEDAIHVISHLRAVFTAGDVADYSNLKGLEKSISAALQRRHGEILNLGIPFSADHDKEDRYIKLSNVEKWWVSQTLRWANSGPDYMTAAQLAAVMSLAFDECRWSIPPETILQVGRHWTIVADGCLPGTYVFPWASMLRANPQLADTFSSILDPKSGVTRFINELKGTYQQYQWQRLRDGNAPGQLGHSAIVAAADEALKALNHRQAEVIRGRLGFDTGHKATLEDLGLKFGVTRERIRQIEKKVLKKLKGLPAWCHGFAAHFILSGGSLLIPESEITPKWELLSASIELNANSIPELGLRVLGPDNGIPSYQNYLDSNHAIPDVAGEWSGNQVFKGLWFLPRQDAIRLCAAEQEYRERQQKHREQESIRTLPRMAFQALRSIGRAAHYSEIAEECNRMFPERQTSIRNWHAVICRPESLALGIVWIGRRGTYGLEEQGYTRPSRDIFEATASIVEARFTETGQPVTYDFVLHKLREERHDPDATSVNMALSLNDRLKSMGQGRYVPSPRGADKQPDTTHLHYDLDAGVNAFLSDDDG